MSKMDNWIPRPTFVSRPLGIPPQLRDAWAMREAIDKQILDYYMCVSHPLLVYKEQSMKYETFGSHFEHQPLAPQRESVTVDGVTLTRKQLEKAWVAINTPLPSFKPLQRVRSRVGGMRGVVLPGGWIEGTVNRNLSVPLTAGSLRILGERGATWTLPIEDVVAE